MAPWAGRLRNGLLNWNGGEHHFPTDMAPPDALHGLAVWRAWEVVEATENRAVLAIDLNAPWPFGGRVFQTIGLEASRLTVELRIDAGDRPMPVIAGWHPWFVRVLTDRSGSAVVRSIPAGPWDDCFFELESAPVVRWPGVLEARVESEAPFWVIYTEPTDYVCVQPQSGPPNGLNTGPYAVAAPGAPFQLSMTIAWKRLGSR
jgi:galactose mutarotase-like enzyme